MTELAKKGMGKSVFLTLYVALTRNPMCHSASTKNVKVKDAIWCKDVVGIVFAYQRNDQEGTRKRVP
eukprot:9652010-Ditylum_brightwellii.AAC.1